MNEVPIKSPWASLTIWLQVASVLAAITTETVDAINAAMPVDTPSLWILIINAVATGLVRYISTRQPISVGAAVRPMSGTETVLVEREPVPQGTRLVKYSVVVDG